MMEKLRIALIGAGVIGEVHAKIIADHPLAALAAIVDIDPKTKRIAELYGVAHYRTQEELYQNEAVDAADICTPEETHITEAIKAANAKKHIFLEKPIAKTVADAKSIQEAAKINNVRLMIGHVLKFDPRYVALNEAVKSGQLGEISSIFVRRNCTQSMAKRLNGKVSFLYYLAVHDIEWMLDYVGSCPVKAYAQYSAKGNAAYHEKDTMFAVINFENGAIGCIETCWALPDNTPSGLMSAVNLVGTLGSAALENTNHCLTITLQDKILCPDILHWPLYNGAIHGDLREELNHFILATLGGKPYLVNTDNAIAAIGVVEGCLQSMETGHPVILGQ
jgi:predicted dehydrogenase